MIRGLEAELGPAVPRPDGWHMHLLKHHNKKAGRVLYLDGKRPLGAYRLPHKATLRFAAPRGRAHKSGEKLNVRLVVGAVPRRMVLSSLLTVGEAKRAALDAIGADDVETGMGRTALFLVVPRSTAALGTAVAGTGAASTPRTATPRIGQAAAAGASTPTGVKPEEELGPDDGVWMDDTAMLATYPVTGISLVYLRDLAALQERLTGVPVAAAAAASPSGGADASRARAATVVADDKKGWLRKRGAINKRYKQRWVVLKPPLLSFFKKSSDVRPQRTVDLTQMESVVEADGSFLPVARVACCWRVLLLSLWV